MRREYPGQTAAPERASFALKKVDRKVSKNAKEKKWSKKETAKTSRKDKDSERLSVVSRNRARLTTKNSR